MPQRPPCIGPSIKDCTCGARAECVNSYAKPGSWYRRYKCQKCDRSWSTLEGSAERAGRTMQPANAQELRRMVGHDLMEAVGDAIQAWVQAEPAPTDEMREGIEP